MTIALVAHDTKKELMVQFCIAYRQILSEHRLIATGTTGRLVAEATGLNVQRFLPGGNQLAQLSGGIPQFAVFFHCGQVGQNISQGQHAAVRAGFQRLLQRNGACFAPGVAQLHPQLVFNAAAGVTGKAGGAGAVIGIYCFNQADGANADKIILPAGNGIILFYNMCHQPQVVTDQRFARGVIPGAHGGEGGLFLLGGKRLGKAAGFQPEGQVEQMRSSRLQKKP